MFKIQIRSILTTSKNQRDKLFLLLKYLISSRDEIYQPMGVYCFLIYAFKSTPNGISQNITLL